MNICNLVLFVVVLFLVVDLWVNYLTWKGEAKFPSLNYKTIREYRNKCWRSVLPLLVIAGYMWAR